MRIPELTPNFCARRNRLADSPEASKAVGRCVAALTRDPLPTMQDFQTMKPPVSPVHWFRRVPDQNLWIWFLFDDEHVTLVSLSDKPPVPIQRS